MNASEEQPKRSAYGWENTMLDITDSVANVWFKDLGPIPIEDYLTKSELGGPEERDLFNYFAPAFIGNKQRLVLPNLEIDYEDLGRKTPIAQTEIGQKLILLLEKLDVSWFYSQRLQVTHKKFVELNTEDEGVAIFENEFGMPILQRFRVYVNEDGLESLTWAGELLVATREYLHETERYKFPDGKPELVKQSASYLENGGMTFGRWSERINLPSFAKRVFYLAETKFPSNPIAPTHRPMAFPGMPTDEFPRPFVTFQRNSVAAGAYERVGSNFNWSFSLFPTVLDGGWIITNQDEQQLETAIKVASNGLTNISNVLEDGFRNFQRDDFPAPYDETLLSANVFDRSFGNGSSLNGHSQWVPASYIGLLNHQTEEKFKATGKLGRTKEGRQSLWELIDDGVGPFVAAAANNLAWYFMMPDLAEHPEDLPVNERVLLQAARLGVEEDSINCLSNLAIMHYMAGNSARAVELFEAVIANADNYSDNEAYFYLAHIFEEARQPEKAAEYRSLYSKLDPYQWPIQAKLEVSGESLSPAASVGRGFQQDDTDSFDWEAEVWNAATHNREEIEFVFKRKLSDEEWFIYKSEVEDLFKNNTDPSLDLNAFCYLVYRDFDTVKKDYESFKNWKPSE